MRERGYIRALYRDAIGRRRGRGDTRNRAEVAAYQEAIALTGRFRDCRDLADELEAMAARERASIRGNRDTRDGRRAAFELAANMARNAITQY